jgi:hypothetical protein
MTETRDPFKYVEPTAEMQPAFKAVADGSMFLYAAILAHVPDGPDRTLAIRKLQECRMWANCAISFGGDSLKR